MRLTIKQYIQDDYIKMLYWLDYQPDDEHPTPEEVILRIVNVLKRKGILSDEAQI